MTIRLIACLLVAFVATATSAAPVPKTSAVDPVLARVAVEHVGSALAQPGLRKELALTADQEKKLASLSAEYEGKLKKAGGPDVVAGPFDVSKQVDLFKDISAVTQEYDTAVMKLLSDAQRRRLRQVQLQKGGPAGLLNRHVVRALALTAEQEDAMAAELAKYRFVPVVTEELIGMTSMAVDAKADVADDAMRSVAAFLEKEHAEQEKVRQAMLKHLTVEQRATWNDLIGKPLSGPELLRAGSIFGDARVMNATTKSYATEGNVPPPAQAVPPPPPPPVPPPGE